MISSFSQLGTQLYRITTYSYNIVAQKRVRTQVNGISLADSARLCADLSKMRALVRVVP
jgi:hypothetical protein